MHAFCLRDFYFYRLYWRMSFLIRRRNPQSRVFYQLGNNQSPNNRGFIPIRYFVDYPITLAALCQFNIAVNIQHCKRVIQFSLWISDAINNCGRSFACNYGIHFEYNIALRIGTFLVSEC